MEDGKLIITGSHRQVNAISDSLDRRFMENGMPQEILSADRGYRDGGRYKDIAKCGVFFMERSDGTGCDEEAG